MKRTMHRLLTTSVLCLAPFFARSQTSTMEFQPSTTIEVTTGADICADVVTISGSYSGAGTQCGGALPVELVAISVRAASDGVSLSWTTATETDNYGFEIERRQSAEGSQQKANGWQRVGFVAGAGTSSSEREYSFSDKNLGPGRYAYRLKQIDNAATFSYSAAVEVEVGLAAKEFKLESNYPNPFNPSTMIRFTLAEDGKATLRVFNMLGQEVATLFDGEVQAGRIQQVKFDASMLPSGSYVAKLESAGRQVMQKMVLLK